MKKPELVSDWKQAWRWLSMNIMALAASLQLTYMALPDEMKASIPQEVVGIITTLLLVSGMIGRVINQTPAPPEKPDNDIGI